jgi:hypothetical protein
MTGSPLRRTKRSSKLRGSMDFIPTPETVAAPAVVGGGPDVLSSPARRKKVRKGRKYTRSVDNSAKIHAADALDPSKSEISGNTDGVTAPNADSLVPSDSESRSCSKCFAALGRAPQFFSESGAALCSSCHAESQRVICWRCKHGVENPLRAMDQLWHDECFYCEQCKGSITGSFLEVDGLPYHMDCAPEDEDGPVEASGGDDGASNHHVPSSTVVESSPAATVQGQVGVDRLTLVCTYNGTTLSLKFPEDVSLMRVLIDVSDAFHVSDLTLQMMDFEGDLITIKKQADWDYVLMSTLSRGQTILHLQVKQD